mgnify:CR=1 FL=1
MKRNSFILYSIISVLAVSTLISCSTKSSLDEVTISGRQIMVDGTPYIIKGVCYHPVPKGSDKRNFSNLTQDLTLMVEAGINTIRVYEPIDSKKVLDEIHKSGLKIIVGFGYNQDGNFDILSGTFLDYINKYKNHESILLWELGNEYNYHPEWFGGDINNWYNALNDSAKMIHEIDSNHKVTTAHGELPDEIALSMCNEIDVWGMNVYRWDNPEEIFSQWNAISSKPMYLSEAGGDSYMTISKDGYEGGVNEMAQADANAKIMESVFNNLETCSGITLFSFTDGWWKAGNNDSQDIGGWAPNSTGVPYDGTPNEEFWGIVDIERNKKQTFNIIKEKYTSFPE